VDQARLNLERTVIRAPISGVVTNRNAQSASASTRARN
jgi:multidrug resistance efflux pump